MAWHQKNAAFAYGQSLNSMQLPEVDLRPPFSVQSIIVNLSCSDKRCNVLMCFAHKRCLAHFNISLFQY
jgi:hypothetical protein